MSLSLERLRGSMPPLVTPFRAGAVDYDAYAGLVEHQIRHSSHGVVVNGTTSEPSTLTVDERNRLVDTPFTSLRSASPSWQRPARRSLPEARELTSTPPEARAVRY